MQYKKMKRRVVLADEISGSKSYAAKNIIEFRSRIARLWIITAMKQRIEIHRKISDAIS